MRSLSVGLVARDRLARVRRTRSRGHTAICSECYDPLSIDTLQATWAGGHPFTHSCGRLIPIPQRILDTQRQSDTLRGKTKDLG
jgi:hypothetical protein